MYSSELSSAQKDLLRLIVNSDDEGQLYEKGVLLIMIGNDKYMLWGCGVTLDSLADLDELCGAGLLKKERWSDSWKYRIWH